MLLRSKKIPTLNPQKISFFILKKPELLISFKKKELKIQAFFIEMICLTIKGADSAKKSAVSLS